MRKTKFIYMLCLSLGMLSISCRDIDNQKNLDDEQDGTREINTTELDETDNRPSSDTIDYTDTTGVGGEIYRTNDIPPREVMEDEYDDNN